MKIIEHTPGPWQQDWQFIVAPDPDGIHPDIYIAEIAEEDSDGRIASPEQQEANGRLAALVDTVGDEDFSRSVTIDFEGGRTRMTATQLLTALKAVLPYAENEHASLFECWKRDRRAIAEAEAEAAGQAIDLATIAIAAAEAAGITPTPADIDIHAYLAGRRQIAAIWSIGDVQGIRPDLSEEQAWEVLEHVGRKHDAELGITWLTLEMAAEWLFAAATGTTSAEEA